ncbi:MAG: hypothetical protein HY271_11685 [Deltaproteobacteria bacterium]|nr:hypothetical protein [Deltaproteobacteria bacterium]
MKLINALITGMLLVVPAGGSAASHASDCYVYGRHGLRGGREVQNQVVRGPLHSSGWHHRHQ